MRIPTIFVIVGMFIISLYFLIEVDYYSSAITLEKNIDAPYVIIPKIGVEQAINNESIDYGVYHEPQSALPGKGTVILFGHRTLHGSPFLKLDQLQAGDNITLIWPSIGNVEYTVKNTTIVDASYMMSTEQGDKLFLITCYPLGSSAQRLIIEADQKAIYPLKRVETKPNPDAYYVYLLIGGFFAGSMALTYFYPEKDDRVFIFITGIALTLFLVFGYFFPAPTNALESALGQVNSFFGV